MRTAPLITVLGALCLTASAPAIAESVVLHAGPGMVGAYELYEPVSLDVSSVGDLYVLGGDSYNVLRIRRSGLVSQMAEASDGLFVPVRLAVAPNGDVYVANGVVFRAAAAGGVSVVDFGGTFADAIEVAVDSASNLYVASRSSTFLTGAVFKRTPGGIVSVVIDPSGAGAGKPLLAPTRLATDDSGNLYVTGYGSHNAFRVTPGGSITQLIDSSGDLAGATLENARGIGVDGSGNVYVAGEGSSNVFRIAPGGTITEILDGTGDGLGHTMENPPELAVDAIGNSYVVAWGTENVFHVAPDGAVRQILDATGDGLGNTLASPSDVATDGTSVYVCGFFSNNIFRIGPGLAPSLLGSALLGLVSAVLLTGWWAARRQSLAAAG